jgi:hypothetical protein
MLRLPLAALGRWIRAKQATTPSASMERLTTMARHSRVNSSVTFRSFRVLASAVWSNWKSMAQTTLVKGARSRFGGPSGRKCLPAGLTTPLERADARFSDAARSGNWPDMLRCDPSSERRVKRRAGTRVAGRRDGQLA